MENSEQSRTYWLQQCLEFVRSIGIPVDLVDATAALAGFLPDIEVKDGGLLVRADAFPGDVLHEAGHLCVMPACFRAQASGNLNGAFHAMSKFLEDHPEGMMTWPENPVHRACMQSSDPEATAWQFAAASHIGLPKEWLFPEASYEGKSDEIYTALELNSYFGINGLQAAGWTQVRVNPSKPDIPVYPKLAHWTCPA